jgi:hypothetical protein
MAMGDQDWRTRSGTTYLRLSPVEAAELLLLDEALGDLSFEMVENDNPEIHDLLEQRRFRLTKIRRAVRIGDLRPFPTARGKVDNEVVGRGGQHGALP